MTIAFVPNLNAIEIVVDGSLFGIISKPEGFFVAAELVWYPHLSSENLREIADKMDEVRSSQKMS